MPATISEEPALELFNVKTVDHLRRMGPKPHRARAIVRIAAKFPQKGEDGEVEYEVLKAWRFDGTQDWSKWAADVWYNGTQGAMPMNPEKVRLTAFDQLVPLPQGDMQVSAIVCLVRGTGVDPESEQDAQNTNIHLTFKEVELLNPDVAEPPKITVEAWCSARSVAEFTVTERPTVLFAEMTNADPLTLNAHAMFAMTEDQVPFFHAEMRSMPKLCGLALESQEGEKAPAKRKHIELVESKSKKMRVLAKE